MINDDGSVTFDLKTQPPGCYTATLFAPPVAIPLTDGFTIVPAPSITLATRAGTKVKLQGSELFKLKDCKVAALSIQVLDDKGVASTIQATGVTIPDADGAVTFDFAFPEGNATWQVQATAGTATSAIVAITGT